MKDALTIWRGLLRRTYSAVNTGNPDRPEECRDNQKTTLCKCIFGKHSSVITVAFTGLFGILAALFIMFVHPYDLLYTWKCTFGDGGEIFGLWKEPPVDLYLRVFLYNVTNAEEFLSGADAKLKVQEVGPYVYKELMTHENVTFNDNGTLTMSPQHPLVWVPELSEGHTEEDLLVLPNIAVLSIADVVKDASYFTRMGLNLIIRQTDSQPLVKMSAKEFMFGYKSTLMTLGNQFMPGWIYFDKLGLIDRMYEFEGDFATIYTGENDIRRAGLLDTYRGSTKIPQWDAPCGLVQNASDGTKFPGEIKPNDTLLFFRKSMCRAKSLVRINTTVSNGFNGYVYTFANNSDDNGRTNPENACFCKNKDKCLPDGLLDVHGCYYGFPIALSYPHFYNGDPWLAENVEGSYPDKKKHESYFVIEPKSGLPLELAVRYQINMALGNIENIANVERFSNMVLPLLWTETRLYGLPYSLNLRFSFYIKIMPIVEKIGMYLGFIGGLICLMLSSYKLATRRDKEQHNIPWVDEEMAYIDRKLSNYIPEKRTSMTSKELEVYISSLVTPLNQDLSFQEFQEMKEEDV